MQKNATTVFLGLVAVLAIVATFFLGRSAYEKYQRNKSIAQEIQSLQEEADQLQKENKILSDRIAYFQTQEFKEKQAKEKLNVKKPGEQVAVITPSPSQENSDDSSQEQKNVNSDMVSMEKSNPIKWWDYFFGYN